MKSLQELRQFYDSSLLAELQVFEEQRKGILKKLMIVTAISLALAVGVAGLFHEYFFTQPFRLLFLVGGVVVIFIGVLAWLSMGYTESFKEAIIQQIVGFLDERLRYDQHRHIAQPVFMLSQLFHKRIDRFRGEDYVEGVLGATSVAFSEVHAEHKTEHRDAKGRRRTEWHDIFQGLFFVADFNKHFNGRTFVLPDTAERLFGRFGQMFQKINNSYGELVKMEDPEFEKAFAVYADDQIEARYVLSTSLMQRIMEFKKKTGKRVYLSFVESHVFIAICMTRDLFEPRIFKTLLDFEPVQQYYEDLRLAVDIVEDLNLNTRIWTKS